MIIIIKTAIIIINAYGCFTDERSEDKGLAALATIKAIIDENKTLRRHNYADHHSYTVMVIIDATTHACTHVCAHVFTHVHAPAYASVVCIRLHTRMHASTHMSVHMSKHMHAHTSHRTYIHISTHISVDFLHLTRPFLR